MAFLKILLLVLVSVLGFSNSAFVDTLNKCELKDEKCLIELISKALKVVGSDGVPELGIPPIDPMKLQNLNGSIANILDIKLIEGTAKGVKSCTVNRLYVDIEKLHTSLDITCDLTLVGTYEVKSTSNVIKSLLGDDVHGNGNGKVKIEKINIKVDFPFEAEKRGDDIFFISDVKNYKYSFNVQKKITFAADNVYLGNKESSKEVVKLLNENWKIIADTFGGHFMDLALKESVYPLLFAFFSKVSAKHYLLDDLSALV